MPFSRKIDPVDPKDHQNVTWEPTRDGRTLLSWQAAKDALVARGMSDAEASQWLMNNPGSMGVNQ